jgi:tetratricopeptide (TPR) repeat protein
MTNPVQKEKEAFNATAHAYLDRGLYREALELAETWLKRYPMDAEANVVGCHALVKMGKMDSVGERLDNVEDTILTLSRIYAFMGDASRENGLKDEAIWCYQRFLSINPESQDAAAVTKKLQVLMPAPAPVEERTEMRKRDYDDIRGVTPDIFTVTLAKLYNKQGHLHVAADVLFESSERNSEPLQASKPPEEQEVRSPSIKKRRKEEVVQELSRWLNNINKI